MGKQPILIKLQNINECPKSMSKMNKTAVFVKRTQLFLNSIKTQVCLCEKKRS